MVLSLSDAAVTLHLIIKLFNSSESAEIIKKAEIYRALLFPKLDQTSWKSSALCLTRYLSVATGNSNSIIINTSHSKVCSVKQHWSSFCLKSLQEVWRQEL